VPGPILVGKLVKPVSGDDFVERTNSQMTVITVEDVGETLGHSNKYQFIESYVLFYLILSILVHHLENGLVNLLGVSSAQVMATTLDKVKRSLRARSKELDMLSRNSRAKHRIGSALITQ
jgi:hypothetical protein